jgi:hypothetical protein
MQPGSVFFQVDMVWIQPILLYFQETKKDRHTVKACLSLHVLGFESFIQDGEDSWESAGGIRNFQ